MLRSLLILLKWSQSNRVSGSADLSSDHLRGTLIRSGFFSLSGSLTNYLDPSSWPSHRLNSKSHWCMLGHHRWNIFPHCSVSVRRPLDPREHAGRGTSPTVQLREGSKWWSWCWGWWWWTRRSLGLLGWTESRCPLERWVMMRALRGQSSPWTQRCSLSC